MDLLLGGVWRGSLCLVGHVRCGYEGDVSDLVTCCLGAEFSPQLVAWRGEGCGDTVLAASIWSRGEN